MQVVQAFNKVSYAKKQMCSLAGGCIRILACESFNEYILNTKLAMQHTHKTQAENLARTGASFLKRFIEISLRYSQWTLHARDPEQA